MTVYIRVTRDKFELPVAIANSVDELARICGTTRGTVLSSISHKKGTYRRVVIDDNDEEE